MANKWRPSASQRREFAERMKDPSEAAAYEARKQEKLQKKRAGSKFDYNSAGGNYVPTREQHDFCFNNMHLFEGLEEENAANEVMRGFSCNEKIHHDFIHVVNEKRRAQKTIS